MAHRKWKETKQQPGTAGPGNMLGSCLVSFHFLWAILCLQAVLCTPIVTVCPHDEIFLEYSFRMGDFKDCPMSPSASSTTSSPDSSGGLNTRSVEDLRRKYRKEFVKMGTSGGVCQHCGSVTVKLVHYRCGRGRLCDSQGKAI